MNNSSEYFPNATNAVQQFPAVPCWPMFLIGLLVFVTITANLLVIVSFLSEARLRTPFNYYILNLAVSDLLVGAIDIPNYAIYTYYGYWPLSYSQCSFRMFFDYFVTSESLWGIGIISVDRVWAVTFPLSYRQNASKKKHLFIILCSWVISVVAILPGFIRTRSDHIVNSDIHVCDWNSDKLPNWASAFYVTVFGEWLPIVIICACYVVTVVRMRQLHGIPERRVIPALHRVVFISARQQRDRHAFTLLTLLLLGVLTFWTPWLVVSIQRMIYQSGDNTSYAVAYWVTYIMSMANPFLFNAASDDMRRTFRRLLGRRRRHIQNNGLENRLTHRLSATQ